MHYLSFFYILFALALPITIYSRNQNLLKKSYGLLQIYAFLFVLIFFLGFRGYVFSDWYWYWVYFEGTPSLKECSIIELINNYSRRWEPGLLICMSFVKIFTDSYEAFQVINFIANIFLFCLFLKEFEEDNINIYLIVCFFLVYKGMQQEINILRNEKSILLFAISLKYINKKKYLKYILLNAFGIVFHTSALIYIAILPFLLLRIKRSFYLFIIIIGTVVYILKIPILSIILGLPIFGKLGRVAYLITLYSGGAVRGISFGFLERLFSSVIIFIFYDKLIQKNEKYRKYINLFILYMLVTFFCSEIAVVYDRFSALFCISYWILYPALYSILTREKKYLFLILFFLYGSLVMYEYDRLPNQHYDNLLFSHQGKEERIKANELVRKMLGN